MAGERPVLAPKEKTIHGKCTRDKHLFSIVMASTFPKNEEEGSQLSNMDWMPDLEGKVGLNRSAEKDHKTGIDLKHLQPLLDVGTNANS